MSSDILFSLFLYGMGLLPAWLARSETVKAFIGWTAFAWGALAWTIAAIICLMLPLQMTLSNVLYIFVLLWLLFFVWQRRHFSRPTLRGTLKQTTVPFAVFSFVICFAAVLNVTAMTADSLVQLLVANELALEPQQSEYIYEFGYWGPALIMLQAPARWLGLAYFDTLQPAFVVTLLGALFFVSRTSLRAKGVNGAVSNAMSAMATLLLISTPLLLFYAVYVHNNIVVAMYLLIGVSAFWLALKKGNELLFYLAILALLGVSLARTETVLYATVFIIGMLSLGVFSPKQWLNGILVYVVVLLSWNIWLIANVAPATHILTPERIGVVLLAIGAVAMFILLWRLGVMHRLVAPNLHRLLLCALTLAVAGLVLLDATHFSRTGYIFLYNLFTYGSLWWGVTWWLLAAAFLLLFRRAAISYERLFVVGIAGYLLVLLLISYLHPFRLGWGDSANRAFLHVLPITVYYLTLKGGAAITAERELPL